MRLTNPAALEARACDCYGIVRDAYARWKSPKCEYLGPNADTARRTDGLRTAHLPLDRLQRAVDSTMSWRVFVPLVRGMELDRSASGP